MDLRSRPLEDPSRFGAMAAALFSAVGYAACLLLSLIKLRTENRCSSFVDSICADRCATTLHDVWSSIGGLPVTVLGAALYLVTFVLALRASSVEPARWVRVPLLALASFTLAVSAAYATYSALGLSTWCEYCALLYVTSIGLFLGAALLNGLRPIRAFNAPLGTRGRMLAALTMLGLCTSLAVHCNVYRRLAAQEPGKNCTSREVFALPEPFLRIPASSASPPIVAAVFIDFSCPHCRISVDFWRTYQATRKDLLELRIYHFPVDCIGPAGQRACEAARAFECLAPASEGRGLEVLEALFALQDSPADQGPYFSTEHLRAVAAKFAVPDFDSCKLRPELEATVDAHVEFAENNGIKSRPAALLIRMVDGQPSRAIPLQGAVKDDAFLDRAIQKLLPPIMPSTL